MAISNEQIDRREYKAFVDERTVARMRQLMAGICEVDKNAQQSGGRYIIDTLYLDTPMRDIYAATVDDAPDRFKVRIRSYPSAPAGLVFLEVKRRVIDAIHKTRGWFQGDWQRLLEQTDDEIVAQMDPQQAPALHHFLSVYRRLPLAPLVRIRYEREPYFSVIDDYARVTFDRAIRASWADDLSLPSGDEGWVYCDGSHSQRSGIDGKSLVLVELKFTSVVPAWMQHMISTLGLHRLSFCKFTAGLHALEQPYVHRMPAWWTA